MDWLVEPAKRNDRRLLRAERFCKRLSRGRSVRKLFAPSQPTTGGSMNLRKVLPLALPLAAMIFAAPAIRAQQAQQPDHAVTSQDLRQDLQSASQTRQADEAAVRQLFSSDVGT